MPPEPLKPTRKRSLTPRRGAIACVRCKERKAKCVPAPPGSSRVPTCVSCLNARTDCIYLDRTPNEIFLLEYVSQLEARVAALEIELAKYNPHNSLMADNSSQRAMTAAVESLTQQYPLGPYQAMPSLSVRSERRKSTDESEDKVNDDDNDELALGVGLLSLSGLGDPLYLGASSGVNWARVCATAVRRPWAAVSNSRKFAYQAPPETASAESALSYGIENPLPPLPPPPLADHYLEVAYNHVQAQYGFLDWQALRVWHANREAICLNRPVWGSGKGADHGRAIAAFLLWLVYGYGARLTQDERLEGSIPHEVYYNAAISCLSTLTSYHSLATVQCLLLLETYSIWHARSEISTWQVAGLALRTAIELGLHRRERSRAQREKDPLRYEMKKRVFWAVYTMDRMIALQLGRPSGIAETDIDVEFPLNIGTDVADSRVIFDMQNRQIESTKDRPPGEEYAAGYESVTSMTSAIHNTRLHQLKQLIQNTIYRLDKPLKHASGMVAYSKPIPEIEAVLAQLNQWRACRPVLPANMTPIPLLSKEQLEMDYHECVQMLLRPVIAGRRVGSYYASMCAESAAACCEIEHFDQKPGSTSLRLVTWQLYRLFLSGLTLLHLASAPGTSPCIDPSRAAQALHKVQHTIGHLVRTFRQTSPYEQVFLELVGGWESRFDDGQSSRSGTEPGWLGINNDASAGKGSAGPAVPDYDAPWGYSQSSQSGRSTPSQTPYRTPSYPTPTPPHAGHIERSHTWAPLFSSPRSVEAFNDQWGGTINQMGGRMAAPMRNDFYSLLSSFGLETIVETADSALPLSEGPIWQPPGWEALLAPSGGGELVQEPVKMEDLAGMGMGEFVAWTGAVDTAGYEADAADGGRQARQSGQYE